MKLLIVLFGTVLDLIGHIPHLLDLLQKLIQVVLPMQFVQPSIHLSDKRSLILS